jgi:alpha-L-rhamnosidase-like protein
VQGSWDAKTWTPLRAVTGGNGGRDYLYLPESETRWVRVSVSKPVGAVGIRDIAVKPLEWSASKEAFFKAIALEAPRGSYPRGMLGEPSFWTVVGLDADKWEGLLGADGALETGKERFSIEPFLYVDDRLVTWADVSPEPSLEEGCLPIPSVTWKTGQAKLTVTAFPVGSAGSPLLLSRYQVENTSPDSLTGRLFLAIRPFQVNPPSQTLNAPGGCAPIRSLEYVNGDVRMDGHPVVRTLRPPFAFGVTSLNGGGLVEDYLRHGTLPPGRQVRDEMDAASGVLAYRLDLAPHGSTDVDVLVPLSVATFNPGDVAVARKNWEFLTHAVTIEVPKSAQRALHSFRSQIGYILVNRAGPAIQPGTRAYARSWIRDGSLTSSALLRAGRPEVVRQFIEWFAPHQYANGKVPCVVDQRGADPVPEHDSTGEFLFLIAEYYRFTKDSDLVERYWPGIVRGVAYLDSLRHERSTDAYRTPENIKYFGILPPSISHEGYSAKPMHSYWDDFFALRGFKDAAFLATELGHTEDAKRFGEIRDAFTKDFAASILASMKDHGIDYIPGCADLGDFDATSTTIALSPVEASFIPQASLEATFERYYTFFEDRKNGAPWEAFTPYEIRNIGAFVRLGWRDRAQELLQYFLDHQTPRGWNQWAEVVWHDTTTAHFIGDMPHTWVGSDYMRSFLDLFAYDREADQSLVLAAGIPRNWVREDEGVRIQDLRTQYGLLGYQLREKNGVLEARIEKTMEIPRGGLVLRPPLPSKAPRVTVNGKRAKTSANGEVVVRDLPAVVRWSP